MKLSSQMKNLSDEILTSFKNRVKENEQLVNDVQQTLNKFQKDHQEMAAVLSANATSLMAKLSKDDQARIKESGIFLKKTNKDHKDMAASLQSSLDKTTKGRMKNEKTRLIDFDALMKTITADINSINTEVLTIFNDTKVLQTKFGKEHADMSAALKADLSKTLLDRVEYTKNLLNGFQLRVQQISKENQQMANNLHKDLAKSELDRLTNFSSIMKEIQGGIDGICKEVKDIQKATAGLIGDYSKDRSSAAASWGKMSETLSQLRNKSTTIQKPSSVKTETKQVKMEHQEVAVPAEDAKQGIMHTLEQKVLSYINKHPKGVKVLDMEESLGKNRMQLGFVAKNLLENHRVLKVDNMYFPKN